MKTGPPEGQGLWNGQAQIQNLIQSSQFISRPQCCSAGCERPRGIARRPSPAHRASGEQAVGATPTSYRLYHVECPPRPPATPPELLAHK